MAPDEFRAGLPAAPPELSESMSAVLADLDRLVMPGIAHRQSPRFFGYFPANAPLSGVLGNLVSAGLGVVGLSWQSDPAVTELEAVDTDWVRQMAGLSEARPLVVYVSARSHNSMDEAALLAGSGREGIRLVPFDDAGAMRPHALTERRSTATRLRRGEALSRSGAAYLTPAVLNGRWMVCVSVGAEPTERADVTALWEVKQKATGSPG